MKNLTEEEFDEATSDGLVLVDFSADWCGPCKTLEPILEKVSGSYNGQASFYRLDIDHAPGTAAKHGVMSVPTIIIFRGGSAVDRIVGVASEADLKKRVDQKLQNG